MENSIPPGSPYDGPVSLPSYAERTHEVIAVELEHYLKRRRKANEISEAPTTENLSGLCISGGGVRSATLGLGMFQAFIKAGILKHFDYLSTVSGGGYIGSCLSSLLSAEPQRRDKEWDGKQSLIKNNNQRFDEENMGLEEKNSPFVEERYGYPPLETAKLTTKHQLIHLRQYGEYLTPHKSLFGWDVNRAIGALTAGIFINMFMFLLLVGAAVLIHHALFAWMSDEKFILTLQDPVSTVNPLLKARHSADTMAFNQWVADEKITGIRPDTLKVYVPLENEFPKEKWKNLSTTQQLKAWATHHLQPQFTLVWVALGRQWHIAFGFLMTGLFLGWLFTRLAWRLPFGVAEREQDEQNYTGGPEDKFYKRSSSDDMLTFQGKTFITSFNFFVYLAAPLMAYVLVIGMAQSGDLSGADYFAVLALPLCYSLGLFLSLHLVISLYYVNNGGERVSGWLYRSFYTGMQGAALVGLVVAALFPVIIILLFGKHGIAVKLSISFIPVIAAYYFTMQTLSGRAGASGLLANIIRRLQMPLLNLSILLFIGLALAWVSAGLYAWEQDLQIWFRMGRTEVVMILLGFFLLLILALGLAANSNDISLHYFYRDRLAEAYLRTNGKVEMPKQGRPANGPSPKDLFKVNLRSHEDLKLQHMGEGNFRAPYHILVATLNLQGSHDLSAKTLKSEHFIFSKFFIGSRNTGYAATAEYNGGLTKLSTAMTISAAAVASGMGATSFAASNFYMTLLNLRTGYWMHNPKFFIKEKKREIEQKGPQPEPKAGRSLKEILGDKWEAFGIWRNKYPLWLVYLGNELTGLLGSNSRKVYVSDGGHTGDNLGLLPLVQRKCSTIFIADFEEDRTFSFASFSQAVRLAKAIYNADIEINLTPLFPKEGDDGTRYSPASVAVGRITYHKVDKKGSIVTKTGTIVYMKSSMSLLKEAAEVTGENIPPPPILERAPVFVLNYFKNNPAFPHQPTSDQYFDEVQFEAYRMLGEYIGRQAAPLAKFGEFGKQVSPMTKAEREKIEKENKKII